MDRQGWIAVILCIAGLVLWQWFYVKEYSRPPEPAGATATATPGTEPTGVTPTPTPERTLESPTRAAAPSISARSQSVSSKNAEYVFSNDAGGIEKAILLLHLAEQKQAVVLNGSRSMPIGAIGFQAGEVSGGFEMDRIGRNKQVVFRKTEEDGLEIIKTFTPPEDDASNPYAVGLEVAFRNTSSSKLTRDGFYVSTGGAAPIHAKDLPMYTKFDWNHGGKTTGIDVNWFNPGGIPFLGMQWSGAKSLYNELKPDILWAGVTSQYFCTIVTTEKTKGSSVWATRFNAQKLNETNVLGMQGALGLPPFSLAPGEKISETFSIYAGPKDLMLLRGMGGGQDDAMNFGMFGFISEFLLWAMNTIHGYLGNYAGSIIVLTLLIKSALWPVQNKATNEMRKMAALSPKMTEMREKFKDEPQKLNAEMMKMYREYGVNPFSGCLPMLIQIPIFFGFYAMLGSAIELRNSSFLWVTDLSQPDTLFRIVGFPVNILPIVMAGSMIWQMIITPKSGDAMQQRIFYFMPVIFLVFCYNYASALALYWTTQNIFSIVQLYLTRNKPLPELEKKSVVAKREAAATVKKKKRPKT